MCRDLTVIITLPLLVIPNVSIPSVYIHTNICLYVCLSSLVYYNVLCILQRRVEAFYLVNACKLAKNVRHCNAFGTRSQFELH